MISRCARFNIILLGCLATALLASVGCASILTPPKNSSTVRFFLEASPEDSAARRQEVTVGTNRPVAIAVQANPFLTEADVQHAELEEYVDNFIIAIDFTTHGRLVLEATTASSPGKRIVVHGRSDFERWIAAARIVNRLSDGRLRFLPIDMSHEEAERFVQGLNVMSVFLDKGKLR